MQTISTKAIYIFTGAVIASIFGVIYKGLKR
jgi:hypothetical protein